MKKFILLSIFLVGMFTIASIDFDVGVDNSTEIVQTMSFDAVINNATFGTVYVQLNKAKMNDPVMTSNSTEIQDAKHKHIQKNLSLFYTKEFDNSKRINGTSGGLSLTTT